MTDVPRQAVETIIGHRFADRGLLELALRHASVAEARVRSNERLEFLGDAVLGLIACHLVYRKYPALLEGEMTKIKSAVVSRQSCAHMAREIGLIDYLELGKGMKSTPTLPTSLGAAALESVIGAVYLDGGLDAVRGFVEPLLEPRIDRAFLSGHQENYKSMVQQHAQQNGMESPLYVVLAERGPDHDKVFQVCVQIGSRRFPSSAGPSKKQAEQLAALNALMELGLLVDGGGADGKSAGAAAPADGNGVDGSAACSAPGRAGEPDGVVRSE